jgi:hypothetical protein
MAWIRSLLGGANPAVLIRYLTAIIATLFILQRALSPARQRSVEAAGAQSTRNRLEQTRRQEESFIMTAARKVWSTLRM